MVEVTDPTALLAAVAAERDQLAKEKADLYDQFLRRSAEFENFRRRSQRERSEILEFAGMETLRELLPILDDFERALKAPCSGTEYSKGMELIYHRLFGALRRTGLEPLDCRGAEVRPQRAPCGGDGRSGRRGRPYRRPRTSARLQFQRTAVATRDGEGRGQAVTQQR